VVFNGVVIADTRRAKRVLETSHPPVYYIPPEDILTQHLIRTGKLSHCEWKGTAVHYSVAVGTRRADNAAWSYPDPTPAFAPLSDYVAFYAGMMDECSVDGEPVRPQPGGFYGGWITRDITGPFKGEPGSEGW
jgi:uncharacterized protein (DUF427 family)